MFTTIVVGTDNSPTARAAVRSAAELAERYGVPSVHVVFGYRPVSVTELSMIARDLPEEFRESLSADCVGSAVIQAAELQLEAFGVEAVSHVLPMSGAEAILDVAEEVGADLVVVGSRGLGVGRRLMHGSVSTKVGHHAPCSVLVVHEP